MNDDHWDISRYQQRLSLSESQMLDLQRNMSNQVNPEHNAVNLSMADIDRARENLRGPRGRTNHSTQDRFHREYMLNPNGENYLNEKIGHKPKFVIAYSDSLGIHATRHFSDAVFVISSMQSFDRLKSKYPFILDYLKRSNRIFIRGKAFGLSEEKNNSKEQWIMDEVSRYIDGHIIPYNKNPLDHPGARVLSNNNIEKIVRELMIRNQYRTTPSSPISRSMHSPVREDFVQIENVVFRLSTQSVSSYEDPFGGNRAHLVFQVNESAGNRQREIIKGDNGNYSEIKINTARDHIDVTSIVEELTIAEQRNRLRGSSIF